MPPELDAIPPLGTEPISEENPAGENIQDDLKFDQLQGDVQALISQLGTTAEMEAVGDREPPSWEKVSDLAFDLFKNKSKDIRLASFLTIGMTYARGYEGLRACLEMLTGLLTNFWDTLYPPLKLLRGRVNTIAFIASQVAGEPGMPGGRVQFHLESILKGWEELQKTNPTMAEEKKQIEEIDLQLTALKACGERVAKLREIIYEKFPQDKLPPVTTLTDSIKTALPELESFVKQHKPAEPPAPAPGATASGQARPAGAPAASIESPEEIYKLAGRCAPVLRQADNSNPAAYRMSRWAVWGVLNAVPPTTDGTRTRIPDPQRQEGDQMKALLAGSNWVQLLNQSEERFPRTPLWLDRQYHVFAALGGLGPAFRAAQQAVCDELAYFLKRLPGLQNLAFAGGLPLADSETQAWIQSVVTAEGGGGGGVPAGGGGGVDDGLGEALGEARELANDGKLVEAVRKLQAAPKGSQSARARFLWRMAQAQLAQDAGRGKQMTPVWEELVAVIDRHQLEEWEPELCLKVFRTLWQLTKADRNQAELAQQMYRRMCRTDPAAALEG